MANNKLTKRQVEFCKLISKGESATRAYKIAYKSTSEGTCKVNGSKLLKKPEIAAKIAEFQKQNADIVKKAHEKAIDKLAEGEIADKIERQKMLTQIMRGDVKIRADKFFFDGKTAKVVSQEVEELPDYAARIKAISELNKMDGSYAPTKVAGTDTNGNDIAPQPTAVIQFEGKKIEIM